MCECVSVRWSIPKCLSALFPPNRWLLLAVNLLPPRSLPLPWLNFTEITTNRPPSQRFVIFYWTKLTPEFLGDVSSQTDLNPPQSLIWNNKLYKRKICWSIAENIEGFTFSVCHSRSSCCDQWWGRLCQPSPSCQPRDHHPVHSGCGSWCGCHRDDAHPSGGESSVLQTRPQLQQTSNP